MDRNPGGSLVLAGFMFEDLLFLGRVDLGFAKVADLEVLLCAHAYFSR